MHTLKQRCKVTALMKLLQSVTAGQRRFRALYGPHCVPDQNIIHNAHRKLIKTGFVMDRPHQGRSRSGKSVENVAAVRETFDLSLRKSIRRASSELNISATFIQGSGSGNGPFSVEAEAQKFHRFHIEGKNRGRKEIGSAILRRRANSRSINIKK